MAIVIECTRFVQRLATINLGGMNGANARHAFGTNRFFGRFVANNVADVARPLLIRFMQILDGCDAQYTTDIGGLVDGVMEAVQVQDSLASGCDIGTRYKPYD